MKKNAKTIVAGAGAILMAAVPTALAFAQDFNPSGGDGGSGGSAGYEQGYSQGEYQGSDAGYISTGPSIGGTTTLLSRSTVNQRTGSKVGIKAHNSNKAGNANGAKGGNAFNRF